MKFEQTSDKELLGQQLKLHMYDRWRMAKKLSSYCDFPDAEMVVFSKDKNVINFSVFLKDSFKPLNIDKNNKIEEFLKLFPLEESKACMVYLAKPPDKPKELTLFSCIE